MEQNLHNYVLVKDVVLEAMDVAFSAVKEIMVLISIT